jgi:hypothetical protein
MIGSFIVSAKRPTKVLRKMFFFSERRMYTTHVITINERERKNRLFNNRVRLLEFTLSDYFSPKVDKVRRIHVNMRELSSTILGGILESLS